MPKCKNCKQQFIPITTEKYCMESKCVTVWVESEKQKDWKNRKAKLKEELLTVGDYLKIAQGLFNEIVRIRDKDKGCISCLNPPKKFNAGHYHNSNNHPNVRFDLDNVHGQCEPCNAPKKGLSGNLINYRKGLLNRIGEQKLNELDARAIIPKTFTKDEVKEMIADFRKQLKELKICTHY